MRITMVLDDELLKAAQEATGLMTRSAVVEKGLRSLVTGGRQEAQLRASWEAVDNGLGISLIRRDRPQSE